jgi:hypothetical protein
MTKWQVNGYNIVIGLDDYAVASIHVSFGCQTEIEYTIMAKE